MSVFLASSWTIWVSMDMIFDAIKTGDLVLFDLDGTLLRGDSDHAWGEFLLSQGMADSAKYRQKNDAFFKDYEDGVLNIYTYLAFVAELLDAYPKDTLLRLREEFLLEVISPMICSHTVPTVKMLKGKGCRCAVITSTNDFIAVPIGKILGIDDVVATVLDVVDGRFTGAISGFPCIGEYKILKTQEWLYKTNITYENSWFCTDSFNDLPMLEWVDVPLVVSPDPRLLQAANKNGWNELVLDG